MVLNQFMVQTKPIQQAHPQSRPTFSARRPSLIPATNPPKFGNGLQDFVDKVLPVDPNGDWRQPSNNHPAPLSNQALILIAFFPALATLIGLKLANFFKNRNDAAPPELHNANAN